jgi:hypothetical protein
MNFMWQVSRQLLQVMPECVPGGGQAVAPVPALPPPPKLYIITPTYRRPEQQPEMTRLSQTLLHLKNIKWLVIEDASAPSPEISKLLKRTGIDYDHLVGQFIFFSLHFQQKSFLKIFFLRANE